MSTYSMPCQHHLQLKKLHQSTLFFVVVVVFLLFRWKATGQVYGQYVVSIQFYPRYKGKYKCMCKHLIPGSLFSPSKNLGTQPSAMLPLKHSSLLFSIVLLLFPNPYPTLLFQNPESYFNLIRWQPWTCMQLGTRLSVYVPMMEGGHGPTVWLYMP